MAKTQREREKTKTNQNQVPQWTLTVASSCKVLDLLLCCCQKSDFVTRSGDFSEPLIEPGDKCGDYLSGISYFLHSGCSSSHSTGTLGGERSGSTEVCLKHSSVLQPDRGLHWYPLLLKSRKQGSYSLQLKKILENTIKHFGIEYLLWKIQ